MNQPRHFHHPWVQLAVLLVVTLAVILFVTLSGWLEKPLVPEQRQEVEEVGRTDLPDFRANPAGEARKTAFFEFLRPILRAENREISRTRERVKGLAATLGDGGDISEEQWDWLRDLARRYRVDLGKHTRKGVAQTLLRRVDVIPESLVLVQAAKESAWGTSRFAREGNNLFGQWCFTEGCGMVPTRRQTGKTHEVETFESVRAAVDSYLRNLNSHPAYARLREIRASRREAGKPLTGFALAGGLQNYSEQGEKYVSEVRAMIRRNGLEEAARES